MTLSLTAYLNQRFQFTYDVTGYAGIYSGLASATWLCQIRPSFGSPVVTLAFQTGGSMLDPTAIITYDSVNKLIIISGPTALLVGIAAGTYAFDFGFTLPGDDFERVDGGTITFASGATLAGVVGSPSAPAGSDDTVILGAGSLPSQVPSTLVSALGAANSSASAAATSATAAAASAATALTEAGIATSEAATAVAAVASISASNLRVFMERLTVTATNTLSSLTHTPNGLLFIVSLRGQMFLSIGGASAFSYSGTTLTWNATNAGSPANPGDAFDVIYSY